MKLTSFSCTIELSKDENGYSNNYYVSIDEHGVNVSHPYINVPPMQSMFITKLIHDFIEQFINFDCRIDGFNRDMKLEQYAPPTVVIEETSEVSTESIGEAASV